MTSFCAKFDFAPHERLVQIVWAGEFSIAAAERAISALLLHPQYEASYRRCYDLREMVGLPQLPPFVQPFVEMFVARDPIVQRRALVGTPEVVAKCRPFGEFAGPDLWRAFLEMPPALVWLREK